MAALDMITKVYFNGGMPKMDKLIKPFLEELGRSCIVEKIDFIVYPAKKTDLDLNTNAKKVFIGYSAGALNLPILTDNLTKIFDLIIFIAPAGIENPPTIKHLLRFYRELFYLHDWQRKFSIIGEMQFDSIKSPRTSLAGLKKILTTNIVKNIWRQKELGAKVFFLKGKDDRLFKYLALEKIQAVETVEMPGGHLGIIEQPEKFSSEIKKIIKRN